MFMILFKLHYYLVNNDETSLNNVTPLRCQTFRIKWWRLLAPLVMERLLQTFLIVCVKSEEAGLNYVYYDTAELKLNGKILNFQLKSVTPFENIYK